MNKHVEEKSHEPNYIKCINNKFQQNKIPSKPSNIINPIWKRDYITSLSIYEASCP